jgi:hypothetical protein
MTLTKTDHISHGLALRWLVFFVKNDIYFCGKGILLTGKMKKKTHGS